MFRSLIKRVLPAPLSQGAQRSLGSTSRIGSYFSSTRKVFRSENRVGLELDMMKDNATFSRMLNLLRTDEKAVKRASTTSGLLRIAAPLLVSGNTQLYATILKKYLNETEPEEIDDILVLDSIAIARAIRFASALQVTHEERNGMMSIFETFEAYLADDLDEDEKSLNTATTAATVTDDEEDEEEDDGDDGDVSGEAFAVRARIYQMVQAEQVDPGSPRGSEVYLATLSMWPLYWEPQTFEFVNEDKDAVMGSRPFNDLTAACVSDDTHVLLLRNIFKEQDRLNELLGDGNHWERAVNGTIESLVVSVHEMTENDVGVAEEGEEDDNDDDSLFDEEDDDDEDDDHEYDEYMKTHVIENGTLSGLISQIGTSGVPIFHLNDISSQFKGTILPRRL